MARAMAAILCLLFAGSATFRVAAQDPPRRAPQEGVFGRLDSNGDGVVTKEEVGDDNRQRFEFLLRRGDKNKDGKLTQEEFTAALSEPLAGGQPAGNRGPQVRDFDRSAFFRRLDANGDGKVSKEEMPEHGRQFLQRFDTDGDGALSKAEFERVPPPAQARNQSRPTEADATAQLLFRALDTDGDGTISAEERSAAPKSLAKLDRNGDGKLTRVELTVGARPTDAPTPTAFGKRFESWTPTATTRYPRTRPVVDCRRTLTDWTPTATASWIRGNCNVSLVACRRGRARRRSKE